MKRYQSLLPIGLCLLLAQLALSQTPNQTASALPRLVRFSGTVKDANGSLLTGPAGVTFALYAEQTGGAPLWQETQNVTADSNGRYTALLGATKPEGLPAELFTSEQAHWVGVQVEGQPEQPRVLLVSAPYALKAGDAETVGGLPPSAFMLAAPSAPGSSTASGPGAVTAGARDAAPAAATDVTTTGGTANYLPLFTGTTTILDSVVYQLGTGPNAKIGINTITPAAALDVEGGATVRGTLGLPAVGTATAAAGQNSQEFNLQASVFNSGTGTAVPQTFQLKAEPVGNDTPTASAALSVLYGSGRNTAADTGLRIASNGLITFATGQTFPGTGSVTSVGSGAGLTGGPITSSGSLSIATGGVGNAMLANPSLMVLAGTDLTGGGSVALGGSATLNLDTTKVPQLNAANIFTGNQSVTGNITASGMVQGGVVNAASTFDIGGAPVIQISAALSNLSAGLGALPSSATGSGNTAVGGNALQGNTTGYQNTAVGYGALAANNGVYSTAVGYEALFNSSSGGVNTAIGAYALFNNINGGFNVAVGHETLDNNTGGDFNTATGVAALSLNTTGSYNIAIGSEALSGNTTGSFNIAIGGGGSITTTSYNIDIGNPGVPGDTGTIRIGAPGSGGGEGAQTSAFIAGIYGNTTSANNAVEVMIDSNGNLGTTSSSRRYKEDIQDMADASNGLLRLRPVTFRYKKPYSDGSQPVQYGLIAEEVADVYPDLVARSAGGQIETVKYQVLGPMLLNEMQKQGSTIAAQKEQIEAQAQRIRSLEERLARIEGALQQMPLPAPVR